MRNPAQRIARTALEKVRGDPDEILASELGYGFKKYREAFRRAEAGELPPFPLHLDVDVTTRCQLRCPICPAGAGGAGYPGMGLDLDPALYARALEEGVPKGLSSVRIGVTGEPLLIDSPWLWVQEAAGRGIKDISLITNGQLLDEDAGRKIMEAGLTRLMISVDAGTEEGYRLARPGGELWRLEHNLLNFLFERKTRRRRLPLIRLSFVDREGAETERKRFRERFSPYADYLTFQSYSPVVERGRLASAGGLAGLAASAAGTAASGALPASGPIPASGALPASGPIPASGALPGAPAGAAAAHWCSEPFARMCLYADGGLFPCCSDYGRLSPAGSMSGGTVEEAWHSHASALARVRGGPLHPSCALCRGLMDSGLKPLAAAAPPARRARGRKPSGPGRGPGAGRAGTEDAKPGDGGGPPAGISRGRPPAG
ncbi:MAG: radical SAM protein [Deltaproteobacteria bacterium]|jgi:hypothetical protein|nr:radical SAM protein [Deltaproteobacteria bacterium]